MNTISLMSALKYAFGLFLGVTGFVPSEQTGLNPDDNLQAKTSVEIVQTAIIPAYLSGNGIPAYLSGNQISVSFKMIEMNIACKYSSSFSTNS